MKICSSIIVKDLTSTTELAGASFGSDWFMKARDHIDSADPGLHVIDFSEIRLATVSWIRESVLALKKYASTMRPDIFLTVANMTSIVQEEFAIALEATSEIMVSVTLSDSLTIQDPVLMGSLDAALKETLCVIQGHREFDASLLSRSLTALAPSAANNRLKAIESKGLFKSERRGRTRVYWPILEGLDYGL